MSTARWLAAAAMVAWSTQAADLLPGDADRGKELFQTQQCVQCHSINGQGGKIAPDLGRRLDRDYTPAVMASLMWNHAPQMWDAMEKQGVTKPHLSQQQAEDLFAFFVSARFFEKPGDAARGKQAFSEEHCADCHGITSSKAAGAPPVTKWESLALPIALAQQMWNHAGGMRQEFAKRKLRWPQLNGQQLTDILVYLRNLPETRGMPGDVQMPAPENNGQALFQSKGCAACHAGAMALENRLRGQTLTDIAADMWDHAPNMPQPPPQLTVDEMRQILGYIWARQYFGGQGSAEHGKRVFAEKGCATCHNNPSSGAPNLAAQGKNAYTDITVVSVLWDHGPQMLQQMRQKNINWPRFTAQQMSDLIAYLNTL